jgi:acyl-CoA synthetase (NDP forming)
MAPRAGGCVPRYDAFPNLGDKTMNIALRRSLAATLALSLAYAGVAQAAQPLASSSAGQLIGAEQVVDASQGRALLERTLQRADVAAALEARGVSVDAARERVAALTDAEAAHVAAQIDAAPAGGDVIGTLVFIFVVLLITDILGFTKIFPFTRSIR